jgi:hypothetical protein
MRSLYSCQPEVRAAQVRAGLREVLQTDVATVWMLAGVLALDRASVRGGLDDLARRGEAASNGHASEALRVWRIVPPAERPA